MPLLPLRVLVLTTTTLYKVIASWREGRSPIPGQQVDVGGYRLHCVVAGKGHPTIVLDHSLGGVEGYLLLEKLSKLSRVCIYDRAGYGWSDRMHTQLANLSTNCIQLHADNSGHFVWVDQPNVMIKAVQILLEGEQ